MSFVQTFKPEFNFDCSSVFITDTTGVYGVSNPTGYGSPNPITGSFNAWSLLITAPDSSQATKSGTGSVMGDKEILASDFSLTVLPSGIYTIHITQSTSTGSLYTTDMKALNTCNENCCLDKLKANALITENSGCDCNNHSLEKMFLVEALISEAKFAVECDKLKKATNILTRIQSICASLNCDSCNQR